MTWRFTAKYWTEEKAWYEEYIRGLHEWIHELVEERDSLKMELRRLTQVRPAAPEWSAEVRRKRWGCGWK
jgi:hypothetical protein